MESRRPNVFRVSGIPAEYDAGSSAPQDAEAFLRELILDKLKDDERGKAETDIQIVPSCTVLSKTVNALIEFSPKDPEFLKGVIQNRESSLRIMKKINSQRVIVYFDMHFAGLTQLYPTPSGQNVTVE